MGQLVLSAAGAAVGAVAGTFLGNPVLGAEIGFQLGGIAGALLFRQKGPNPSDIRIQDSAYGKPVPLVYGMYRVAGNIIWTGQPYVSNAGKGGKGPQQDKVSMSFAIALCAGPITSVRRIWANGKLIYDVSDPSNFQALSGSATMVQNFTVYPGDENQQPDPTIQAEKGVNLTPAFRGLAYVVFNDLDLSQWGNYLPSFSFEVVVSGANSYGAYTQTTYTLPGGGSWYFSMAPCVTAQGAIAMMTNGNSSAGVTVANLTAYGACNQSVLHQTITGGTVPAGWSLAGTVAGNSDVPGAYFGNIWLNPDGTYDLLPNTPQVGFDAIEVIFGRSGDDLFLMSYWGGGSPLYRCSIRAGGAVEATTTVQINSYYGASADYVYAGYYNTLYQMVRETLTVVQSWSGVAGVQGASIGYVVDENHVYLLYGSGLWLFDPATGISANLGYFTFAPTSLAGVSSSLIVAAATTGGNLGSATLGYLALDTAGTNVTVAEAVADICNRAELTAAQYDVSQLTDTLNGYSVTNHSAPRSNLAPLMSAFFFDACDSGGVIRFVKRGAQPVGTFLYADLGASPNLGDTANTTPITETIAQEVDLPRSMQLTYPELGDDYNPNTQRAMRAYTKSNRDTVMQAPIVLAGSDALARTQAMLWSAWVGRKTFQFTTGLAYLQYEPGDVMTLQGANGESWTVRITRCQYDGQGSLLWTAALEGPDIYPGRSYTTQGGAALGFASQQVDYSGPTILSVLDIPPLRDADSTPGVYIAACGMASSWPGAAIDLSRDDVTFTQFAQITQASVMGYAANALSSFGGGNLPDEINTVSIVLYEGALASCSYADFLAGANAAWLGGEILFFRNATQTAASTWTLSGLLRGRGGTEAAMTTHAAGERFVLLDPAAVLSMPIQATDFGSTLYFETFLRNLFSGSPGAQVSLMPKNGRVMPLSPVYFMAAHGSASSTSDISLSWIRRARVRTQWLDGADVPLDESAENYTLTILNGSTTVRTVTVAGNGAGSTWTFTAANITADGFSTGATITFRVQQNSDQGVLGASATTTITR